MDISMRKLIAALPLTMLLFVGTAKAQDVELMPPPPLDPVKVRATMEKAVDGFIRPGYETFRDKASLLEGTMKALCADPSADRMKDAKQGFADTVDAWSHIEVVRVGPVIEQNRFERILYYPDKKGLGLKQVQRYLTDKDESVTTAEGLKTKSVAAQGLGALEFVLYGTGADALALQKNDFRCRYGAAIAGNLANIGNELVASWTAPDGTAKNWKEPGPDNPVFRDEREALVAMLGILVHASEAIRDQRIETFYKGPDNVKFPRTAIYWRSGLTWKSIGDNIAAVQDLLHTAQMGDLLPPDQRSIIGSIDFIAKSMVRVSGTINPDVEKALADDKERAKVDYLLLNGKDLIYRINDQYGGAIGLSSGFSFSDGD
ncbi:imelysin family protein [Agrobacterium sp. SORGH_AS 787]|uniref:imelysin family protein n=1 Tax=Agrobacterium sp. SORGH_AS 787 TaxID=3041775 RepID=UPI0027861ED5|nr:putative lipoprotein [Rhizobium sp. SORGH_AS_0787]